MRPQLQNFALFIVLVALAYGIIHFGQQWLFPPKPVPPPPTPAPKVAKDLLVAVAGGGSVAPEPFNRMTSLPRPKEEANPAPAPAPAAIVAKPAVPRALIALGDDTFNLKVLLTNLGGGVQQVVLTKFDEATRLGREINDASGKRRPLHLIPGYVKTWNPYLAVEPAFVALAANCTAADIGKGELKLPKLPVEDELLSRPSYVLLHYPSRDDPTRPRDAEGQHRNEDDNYPLATLATRTWEITSIEQPSGAPWKVVFETELAAPYHVRLRKIFTLAPNDYDFKMAIDVIPLANRVKGAGVLRYQIMGPLGMPIEGEWYTSSYRTAFIGWADAGGKEQRAVEDPSSIHFKAGSDKTARMGTFHYAAVGTQYFASAIAPDGDFSEKNQPWEYVRATREQLPAATPLAGDSYDPDKAHLYDITVRAVSAPIDLAAGDVLRHDYSIYNGPIKVRLLNQLTGDRAVDRATINRYLEKYRLDTLTDYHSPHFFGRFANAIFWADVVISATNVMHELLGFLHSFVGNWGVSIILLTMCVKLALIIPSRRQQAINAKMQAQIAMVKPQLDEINAKYRNDFMVLSQEKQKLFRKAGIRQSAQLGGCLLLFAQMPILMGLYFALQESIFFRLEEFLWMPNLAAPDMLKWWSEQIPMISSPDGRFGGMMSFLYLGPYFNLLPLFAVVLFYVQQKLTMPPPTDEQQEMQQKMMKYMLVFSALFFYKVASGLCVYFIVSGLWSLIERNLIPKPKIDEKKVQAALAGEAVEDAPAPTTWLGKKKAAFFEQLEELQKQAETQRQIRNTPNAGGNGASKPPAKDHLTREQRRSMKKRKK
jgi:YidC/Oxa1 family membrane protein insertase